MVENGKFAHKTTFGPTSISLFFKTIIQVLTKNLITQCQYHVEPCVRHPYAVC